MSLFTEYGVLFGALLGVVCFGWFALIASAGCKSEAGMIGVGCFGLVAAAVLGVLIVFGTWLVERAEMLSP